VAGQITPCLKIFWLYLPEADAVLSFVNLEPKTFHCEERSFPAFYALKPV